MVISLPVAVSSKDRDVTVNLEFSFSFVIFFWGNPPPPTLSHFEKGAEQEGQLPGSL